MEKNVIISIQSKQSLPQCEPETVKLVTEGTLEDRGEGGIVLSYQESETSGLESTLTTVRVEPGRVTVQRTGSVNSQMIFEEDKQHVSLYHTPYGALEVGLRTRKVHISMDGRGGDVTVYYALAIERGEEGRNMLHINVRPAAQEGLDP